MPCPNCDHTMQALSENWFWCPRCGTVKKPGAVPEETAPKLVGYCRQFEEALVRTEAAPRALCFLWRRLGLQEAIQPPRTRKPTE